MKYITITCSLDRLAATDAGMHMQVQEHYTIWRPELKIAIAGKWSASYWPLWASLCLVSMKKDTFFFLLLIRTGQHLSVYMAAHSGYQISDINIFLDVVCLCTQRWWMRVQSYIFIFKATWHLHYLRPDPITLELEDGLQAHVCKYLLCLLEGFQQKHLPQLELQLLWMEGCSINNQSTQIHKLVSHMAGNEWVPNHWHPQLPPCLLICIKQVQFQTSSHIPLQTSWEFWGLLHSSEWWICQVATFNYHLDLSLGISLQLHMHEANEKTRYYYFLTPVNNATRTHTILLHIHTYIHSMHTYMYSATCRLVLYKGMSLLVCTAI